MDINLYLSKLISDITLILDITKHMSKNWLLFRLNTIFGLLLTSLREKVKFNVITKKVICIQDNYCINELLQFPFTFMYIEKKKKHIAGVMVSVSTSGAVDRGATCLPTDCLVS